MKTSKISILFLVVLVSITEAGSVSPEIGLMGGYSNLSELVFFTDDISTYGLGLKHGANVGIKAALNIFALDLNAKYKRYYWSATGECDGVIEAHHSMTIPHQVDSELILRTLSVGVGWEIISVKIFKPFVYIDYIVDCDINADIKKNPKNKTLPPPYENVRTDFSFTEKNRTGYAWGAGIDIKISPRISTGLLVESSKFPGNKRDYPSDSIYSYVLPQKTIELFSFNILFNYNF